ncbi:MAG: tRNA guanosine(34) transglycosylase Tgt [Holosporales bacterium]|jgi:queuine tRNA-ribosyltransferase|nr:tRNA guanosine(34) transglycosylase Tgt [Holosporales bacterium]
MKNLYPNFSFLVTHQDGNARAGIIKCPHGTIKTPAFIFCGTKASVKGMFPDQLSNAGTQIILSNTYHLMLQPGAETIKKMGGLHKFMGWDGPLLTDSGGFQIFSLGHGSVSDEIKRRGRTDRKPTLVSITDDGAVFKSYIDGGDEYLTPEKSVEIQRKLGADFILALDECTPYHTSYEYTLISTSRSHRWEAKSFEEFLKHNDGAQSIYGIVQGGVYPELRKQSAHFVNGSPFFGIAIGGTLGSVKRQMYDIVGSTVSELDKSRPIHLLGIGGIGDILTNVEAGIDTFDCVSPTRIARHGAAFVYPSSRDNKDREHINLKRFQYKHDEDPIQPGCACCTCKHFSRAYLHHLIKSNEMLALQAITLHNVAFINSLMSSIRDAICSGVFDKLKDDWKYGRI